MLLSCEKRGLGYVARFYGLWVSLDLQDGFIRFLFRRSEAEVSLDYEPSLPGRYFVCISAASLDLASPPPKRHRLGSTASILLQYSVKI